MKQGIHPEYKLTHVTCSCGNTFTTRSVESELHVELCNQCHPFYTGKQKLVDTGGRVERFQKKYAAKQRRRPTPPPAPAPAAAAPVTPSEAPVETPEASQAEASAPVDSPDAPVDAPVTSDAPAEAPEGAPEIVAPSPEADAEETQA